MNIDERLEEIVKNIQRMEWITTNDNTETEQDIINRTNSHINKLKQLIKEVVDEIVPEGVDILRKAYRCNSLSCKRTAIVEEVCGITEYEPTYYQCPECGEEYKALYYNSRAEMAKEIIKMLTDIKTKMKEMGL